MARDVRLPVWRRWRRRLRRCREARGWWRHGARRPGIRSETWRMLAVGAPAPFGVEQRAACLCRAPPCARRRAEVDRRDRGRSEVGRQARCSLAGGVMIPAGTRGCVSRWFVTGCATMLSSRLGLSNPGGAARDAIRFHVVHNVLSISSMQWNNS